MNNLRCSRPNSQRGSAIVEYLMMCTFVVFAAVVFLPNFSVQVQCRMVIAMEASMGGGSETNTGGGDEDCQARVAMALERDLQAGGEEGPID